MARKINVSPSVARAKFCFLPQNTCDRKMLVFTAKHGWPWNFYRMTWPWNFGFAVCAEIWIFTAWHVTVKLVFTVHPAVRAEMLTDTLSRLCDLKRSVKSGCPASKFDCPVMNWVLDSKPLFRTLPCALIFWFSPQNMFDREILGFAVRAETLIFTAKHLTEILFFTVGLRAEVLIFTACTKMLIFTPGWGPWPIQ